MWNDDWINCYCFIRPFHTENLQYHVSSPQHCLRLFTLNQALQNRKRRDGKRHYNMICGVSVCKSKNVSDYFSINLTFFCHISCRRHYLLPVICNRGERQQCRSVVWWSDGIRHFTGYHSKKKKKEMSHTSTHKATLQGQTTVIWQQVVSLATLEYVEKFAETFF